MHRRHDPTFFFATLRLPADMRPAVHALYAFVRQADELVDGPGRAPDPASRRQALDGLETELFEADGPGSSNPAVAALADAAVRHDLPLAELRAYMDSMRVDCGPVRMATRDDLEVYMDGSAAAVGRVMAPLLGAPPAASESFARLGVAFQLTNFIRDVREDWALDRMYLAREDFARWGVHEEEIVRGEATAGFRALVAEEVDRARELFAGGAAAVAAVGPRVRPGMRMALAVYLRVLDRVERLDYDVLARRAALSPWEAGRTMLGSLRAAT
ncbi:MAG: phytoene/squalene synthase family protein [Actinomycetota bacterium]